MLHIYELHESKLASKTYAHVAYESPQVFQCRRLAWLAAQAGVAERSDERGGSELEFEERQGAFDGDEVSYRALILNFYCRRPKAE